MRSYIYGSDFCEVSQIWQFFIRRLEERIICNSLHAFCGNFGLADRLSNLSVNLAHIVLSDYGLVNISAAPLQR